MRPETLTLRWYQMPEHTPAPVEVAFSRQAIAAAIRKVLPHVQVDANTLTFSVLGDGRTQVNIPIFGPVGALEVSEKP